MIREIINFTESLIADTPDIMEWKLKPSVGLHVFIDIDENGRWVNQDLERGKDYEYYDGKKELTVLLENSIKYEFLSKLIGNDMNKCLDNQKYEIEINGKTVEYPIKQIQSCSPFVIGFKRKEDKTIVKINGIKTGQARFDVVEKRAKAYLEHARFTCNDDIELNKKVTSFIKIVPAIFERIPTLLFSLSVKNQLIEKTVYDLNKNDFILIYLRTVPIDEYQKTYDSYLTSKLFLKNDYNSDKIISDSTFGVPFYKTSFNEGKPFLKHVTSVLYEGLNTRISAKDVKMIYNFTTLLSNKVFPNPLPIWVDSAEFADSKEIIKIFNDARGNKPSYIEVLKKMFDHHPNTVLQKYYLLNIQKGEIVDFDFVPLFRFNFESKQVIRNVTQVGIKKDNIFELFIDEKIKTIFDFERSIVREIFNNSLLRIDEQAETYTVNYFGDIDPKYVRGGDTMFQMIIKYRKAFYDYIYKSKLNAINTLMFDDMMYNSILSNIRIDEVKGRFRENYPIRKKINIWFSLYELFNNNNSNTEIMASKVPDLMSKMRSVAKGETNFETSEEFAFGAGQVVSYLFDRSAASVKTYAMLEPYLQKIKSNQLQDAIAQTIIVYKHDIKVYKSKFEYLSAQVLTDGCDAEMKPLLKYFLAGCFNPCVIYEREENKEENLNTNN